MNEHELTVVLPPHARLVALVIDESTQTARIKLEGIEKEHTVSADRIYALCGARIVQEIVRTGQSTGGGLQTVLTAST